MIKTQRVHILSATLLVAGVAFFGVRNWRRVVASENPQDTIYAMLEAERTGDVDAYLGQFAGALRASLHNAVQEKTKTNFAAGLRDSSAPLKGIALSDPVWESNAKARVAVAFIYRDHNQNQTVELERIRGAWRITQLDVGELVQAKIPYGTPMRNRWQ